MAGGKEEGAVAMECSWWFLKNLNTDLPHNPAIPLLGIYPKELKARTDICTPVFPAALYTMAKR